MEHATCLGCGCACDDIDIRVRDGRIVDARRACELGVAWFGDGRAPARSTIDGREAAREAALDAAAALLAPAARSLVYLAPDLSCEAQRQAVALADCLGAALDSVTSATAIESLLAAQERGRAGATLGEIRHRADLVVFWGVDPATAYPRYSTRYAPDIEGRFVPDGRRSRTVVAIDVGTARGPADADVRVGVAAADEVAALAELAAMVAGSETASPAPLRDLAARLRAASYAAIVADAERPADGDAGRAGALIALTQALNGPTRAALSLLRDGGNRSGADAVMTAQTGFPAAVDFSRGYPRYRPHDGRAFARLQRGEVDAVAILGAAARIPASLVALMARLPAAVIGPHASDGPLAGARVVVDTGIPGIHDEGTALRMDDVPLPLRQAVEGPPSAASTLRALVERLTKADAVGASAHRIGSARSPRDA